LALDAALFTRDSDFQQNRRLAVNGFEIDDELELRPVRISPELLSFERKPLWVSDDFFGQIKIEIGPIEMARLVARPSPGVIDYQDSTFRR